MSTDGAAASQRIDYLDGWRGVAILLVLQAHFLSLSWLDTGRLGVDIFFGLSGALMSRILFSARMPVWTFYKRRISRVMPAFVVFVLVVFGAAAWQGSRRDAGEVVSTLLFLRTYIPAQPDLWHSGLSIGHLWSLNVEEHCYLFLGLLALLPLMRGREAWVLAVASLASFAVSHHYAITSPLQAQSMEIRTEVAGAFVLCSAGYQRVRHWAAPAVRGWMPLAAVALALPAYTHGAHWWTSELFAPLALAFAVNHLGEAPASVRRALATAALRRMGLWSYSIYLWQQPFFEHQSDWPPGVGLAAALLMGVLSFHLWEAPCRDWINRRW